MFGVTVVHMKRAGLLVGGIILAMFFGGTLVYAGIQIESPDEDGVIHACYDTRGKGVGKIRLIDPERQECKDSEDEISWRALNTFEQLEGMPCTFNDEAGTIALAYDESGFASLRCAIPPQSCTSAGECPGVDNECQTPTCTANVCGFDFEPIGTPCTEGSCNGTGSCVPEVCGNGAIDAGEECDDGEADPGDGCDSGCSLEPGWECTGQPSVCSPVCGDDQTVGSEACDDGNQTTETQCEYGTPTCSACTSDCSGELVLTGPYCGDGVVDVANEQCDAGPGGSESCSPNCEAI
jgi:cysteine-rich repeat protein